MSINVRPVTEADLQSIARLSDLGFKDHEWSRAMYPVHDTPGNTKRYLDRQTKAWKEGKAKFFVAVEGDVADAQAPVVGYARWDVTPAQKPESEWNIPYEPWPLPEGAIAEANELMAVPLHNIRLKHYKGNPMVALNSLVVDPAQQKKGIGAKLLRWGLDEADRMGVPSWLEATNAGYKLYATHGYEPVDEIRQDMTKYGVKEPCVLMVMKRPARTSSSQTTEAGAGA